MDLLIKSRLKRLYIYALLVALFQILDLASGTGYVQTNFKTFENYDGKRFDGKCCDKSGSWFSWGGGGDDECSNPCDHSFVLCIGNGTQSSSMEACEFGSKVISEVGGNKITFNSHVGTAVNPIKFQFQNWPGVVKLKIDVRDEDDDGYDFVDHYEYQYNTRDLRREIDTPEHQLVLKGTRTKFNMGLKVYCDFNYYGPQCQTYCTETDDYTGHYRCDPVTGEKICLSGWKGADCLQNIDDCVGHRCYCGATCIDGVNYYSCKCPPSRTGRLCEVEINECANQPCQNGGRCTDALNGFICTCSRGYTGLTCQLEIDECVSGPCLNGGKCIDGEASYTCQCKHGYRGDRCEHDINECRENPCVRATRCVNTPGDYRCKCFPGFTGKNCTHNIDECKSSPCRHGYCLDSINDFTCLCERGYTGKQCDTFTDCKY